MSSHDDACNVTVRSAGLVSREAVAQCGRTPLLGSTIAAWRKLCTQEFKLSQAEITVGTGHQAELWHPGILAKYVWADALAKASADALAKASAGADALAKASADALAGASASAGAAVVHLVVDTDDRAPLAMRAPVTAAADDGALRVAHQVFGAGTRPGVPHADLGGGEPALPCVRAGLAEIERTLAEFAAQPTAALQAWRALRTMIARVPGLAQAPEPAPTAAFDAVPWVCTSELLSCSLGRAIVDRAVADPAACQRAFNLAAAQVPRSARALVDLGRRGLELPFWAMEGPGARRRVGANEVQELLRTGGALAPRGFLTSAMARIGLCDRFVHGTGGEVYERATEAFMHAWLDAALPPFDTVTATLLLPFAPDAGAPHSAAPMAHAAVVTHAERRAAWFDPNAAFDGDPEPKRALLAAVNAAPRRSPERRAAWRALQTHLQRARDAHRAELEHLSRRAEADASRAREAVIRADRTWAVPLYPPEALARLALAIRSQTPSGRSPQLPHPSPTGQA